MKNFILFVFSLNCYFVAAQNITFSKYQTGMVNIEALFSHEPYKYDSPVISEVHVLFNVSPSKDVDIVGKTNDGTILFAYGKSYGHTLEINHEPVDNSILLNVYITEELNTSDGNYVISSATIDINKDGIDVYNPGWARLYDGSVETINVISMRDCLSNDYLKNIERIIKMLMWCVKK